MGRNGNPKKITRLRTVRNVFSSLAVSLNNTHKLNNYANIYKLSDIRTILEHNNSFATYMLLENYFDNVFCTQSICQNPDIERTDQKALIYLKTTLPYNKEKIFHDCKSVQYVNEDIFLDYKNIIIKFFLKTCCQP